VLVGPPFILIFLHRHWDRNRHRENEWLTLAQRLGLSFGKLSSGDRMIDGHYKGYEVGVYTIRTHTRAGDDFTDLMSIIFPSRYTKIVVAFDYPLGDTGLSVSRETLISKAGKLILGEDILSGDEAFDKNFLIRSRPEELAKRVLSNPEIRKRLLDAGYPALYFNGEEMSWVKAGVEKDIDHIQFLMDLLCDISDSIRKIRPSIVSL
jgi:hypothetical protein